MNPRRRPDRIPGTDRTIQIEIDTSTLWGRRIVMGIQGYARKHGPWRMIIEPHDGDAPFRDFPAQPCDGYIARIANGAMASRLARTGRPVVNVSSIELPKHRFPRVITSPKGTARIAFEHFRSRGFLRFAYVGNCHRQYELDIYRAFESVTRNAGSPCGRYEPGTSFRRLIHWLDGLIKPIGLLCWGASIGHAVIEACRNRGIAVPHDVAVLGTDYDELLSEASHPSQSGIRIASEQIGAMAAGMLDALMHNRTLADDRVEMDPIGVREGLSTDTVAAPDSRMADVIRFLKKRFRDPITVPDVLREHPMARRSLKRKFRDLFGCTVGEHLRRLRISEARRLLAESDDPITWIAEQCGFSSYNYLNRTFRTMTGISPSEYRAQCRGESIRRG